MANDMSNQAEEQAALRDIFTMCWEVEGYKYAFKVEPKSIFDEYNVYYDEDKEYKVIITPERTVIHVLPYSGIKKGIEDLYGSLYKNVKDLGDEEGKMIIPEGWTYQVVQNTKDTIYVPIPVNPNGLTREELDFVNGVSSPIIL